MKAFVALILAGLTALPALADVTAPSGRVIECYCTDKTGSRVELGEMTCLQVDGRMFMAQCQMSQNVPMWREISPGCLSSSLQSPHGPPAPMVDAQS
ncbi:hypothetical protein N6L24_03410 [Cognatishimia sp. SS12]|uniref:hypothetical protein n=1 Tax=Cognatishimia sp. SS12 TaxID=2979465 RepID=UPI00232C22E0|nr:hypothetical protein [Cognatishimia sp. SS12]MDC0737313.1 hypothetical protein [Cognatishimia sp. SS12]